MAMFSYVQAPRRCEYNIRGSKIKSKISKKMFQIQNEYNLPLFESHKNH